jgi:RNA polymerase sigma-70 factor (ECF subfamily)
MMRAQPPEDEALAERLAEVRFARLYEEHGRDVLAYALRRAAGPEDAADATAETFLVAWRRLVDLPPGAEARLWLFGVARRALANHERGERRRGRLAEQLRATARTELSTRPAPDGDGAAVLAAIDRLGAGDRELLLLIGWEELTPGEAAKVLGISALAARTRLHRARARLRKLLSAERARTKTANGLEIEEAR